MSFNLKLTIHFGNPPSSICNSVANITFLITVVVLNMKLMLVGMRKIIIDYWQTGYLIIIKINEIGSI